MEPKVVKSDMDVVVDEMAVYLTFVRTSHPGNVTTYKCRTCGKMIITRTNGNSYVRLASHAAQHGDVFK